jgi:hypothetical protein
MYSHIKDGNNQWSVFFKGTSYTFDATHKNYDKLVNCVREKLPYEEFLRFHNSSESINSWGNGVFQAVNGFIEYKGSQIVASLSDRILAMIEDGFDYQPMLRFVQNLYSNSSQRCLVELYKFLEHKKLPITDDGCFIGWKGVSVCDSPLTDKMNRNVAKGQLIDKYTGKSFRNEPGDINEMPRNQVCDDPAIGCGPGLHIGSFEYAKDWSPTVVICKVNPKDVVSVARDCGFQKLRCCKYEVLSVDQYDSNDNFEKSVWSWDGLTYDEE